MAINIKIQYTDNIEVTKGVLQRDTQNPLLFALFIYLRLGVLL